MHVQDLLSLSDIARLAQVQRPVVTVWRSRSRGTETPFPEPAQTIGAQDLFDTSEIVSWLQATGRGNNPEVDADAAAFSNIARDNFQTVSALLVLRQLWGQPFTNLDAEDLLDMADEVDPDNEFLYSELEETSDNLEFLAAYADKLVDAAYGALPAFESLVTDRFRANEISMSRSAISAQARQIVVRCALELSGSNLLFHEATHGGSDLIHELSQTLDESATATIMQSVLAESSRTEDRMVLRRLMMLAATNDSLSIAKPNNGNHPVVQLAQFPSPGAPATDPVSILQAIDDLVLELGPTQGAVIIAPAAVLVDAMASKKLAGIRGSILRMGRVRAVARLPQGHLLYKPRTALALWVVGPEPEGIPLAERRIMLANLSDLDLDEAVISDFATDIGASLIGDQAFRTHSFRFAQWARTSTVVASTGSLLPSKRSGDSSFTLNRSDQAKLQVELELALDELNSTEPRPKVELELQARGAGIPLSITRKQPTAPLGDLVVQGSIRLISGTRFAEQSLDIAPAQGLKVWNAADLAKGRPTNVISYFELAQSYEQATFTEPGDVVFTAQGKPTAVVDREGSNAVKYPVRILRIDSAKGSELVSEVLAKDINSARQTNWQRWDIRKLPHDTVTALERSLRKLDEERLAAVQRADLIENISQQLISALLSGETEIIDPNIGMEGRP